MTTNVDRKFASIGVSKRRIELMRKPRAPDFLPGDEPPPQPRLPRARPSRRRPPAERFRSARARERTPPPPASRTRARRAPGGTDGPRPRTSDRAAVEQRRTLSGRRHPRGRPERSPPRGVCAPCVVRTRSVIARYACTAYTAPHTHGHDLRYGAVHLGVYTIRNIPHKKKISKWLSTTGD